MSKTLKALQKQKDKDLIKQQEAIQLNKQRILERVKKEFYPFIKASTTSIYDATLFLDVLGSTIQQSFLMRMKETKVGDLGLVDIISTDLKDNEANKWRTILTMMENESVYDMKDLLDNMVREIDDIVTRKVTKEQTLDQLNVELYEDKELAS